jgi:hypothetical protein
MANEKHVWGEAPRPPKFGRPRVGTTDRINQIARAESRSGCAGSQNCEVPHTAPVIRSGCGASRRGAAFSPSLRARSMTPQPIGRVLLGRSRGSHIATGEPADSIEVRRSRERRKLLPIPSRPPRSFIPSGAAFLSQKNSGSSIGVSSANSVTVLSPYFESRSQNS